MNIRPLRLAGTFEITLDPRLDERGHFLRTYDRAFFEQSRIHRDWVQENQSRTVRRHTIRGLHFQRPPFAETKLVRVATGAVLDVFVDLRSKSPTYGQWDSVEVSADKFNMAYIPRGFAHGFCTLTDEVLMLYKVDNAYARDAEGSLRWDDATLDIGWPTREPILSEKDSQAASFASFHSPFEDPL